jgi:peptidyl-tRNA hydrolase, PTH1 family
MENLYLIVGLGNPGSQYARTRHNAGFMVLDCLAQRWRARWTAEKKFQARLARVERDARKVLLCEPETFMNSSGEAVGALAQYYQLPPERILVVLDDADLPLGQLRLRARGRSGGHHGLESIEQHLSTQDYPRLRVGIGREEGAAREITDYVLAPFRAADAAVLEKVLTRACEQIECWLDQGVLRAMNHFNGPVASE